MSSSVYSCPCCGAPLSYCGATARLECASCGNAFDPESIDALKNEGIQDEISFEMPQETLSAEDACGYCCKNCGAELMTDETTTATECPYCGSPTIFPSRIESGVKPAYILPFKVSKEEATNAFHAYFHGKKLMPNIFLNSKNRIAEMRKLYVPYWLFDCDAQAEMMFNAEKVRTERQGDWEIRTTEHYMVCRAGSVSFDAIPVDGSEKLDDKISESLEPFDLQQAVPFQSAMLAGAMADHADVDADECQKRAVKRVETSVDSAIRNTVTGYNKVELRHRSIRTQKGKVTPILAPIWLITTEKEEKNGKKVYTFAINGQTGKLTTDVKPDKSKSLLWGAGIFALALLLSLGVMYALHALGSGTAFLSAIIALLVAIISVSILGGKLKTAAQQSGAASYIREGSFHLQTKRDFYLYKHVDRKQITPAQKPAQEEKKS